eukprot:1186615-Prorocentrum_minimum.AAC.1
MPVSIYVGGSSRSEQHESLLTSPEFISFSKAHLTEKRFVLYSLTNLESFVNVLRFYLLRLVLLRPGAPTHVDRCRHPVFAGLVFELINVI